MKEDYNHQARDEHDDINHQTGNEHNPEDEGEAKSKDDAEVEKSLSK